MGNLSLLVGPLVILVVLVRREMKLLSIRATGSEVCRLKFVYSCGIQYMLSLLPWDATHYLPEGQTTRQAIHNTSAKLSELCRVSVPLSVCAFVCLYLYVKTLSSSPVA